MAAPGLAAPFIIPCYSAAYDPETGAGHILLKDVSGTHGACLDPADRVDPADQENPAEQVAPGGLKNRELAVDALAGLHAFWWDHPRLGKDIGKFPTPAEREQGWADTEQEHLRIYGGAGR